VSAAGLTATTALSSALVVATTISGGGSGGCYTALSAVGSTNRVFTFPLINGAVMCAAALAIVIGGTNFYIPCCSSVAAS
jgi:hypothetical protein